MAKKDFKKSISNAVNGKDILNEVLEIEEKTAENTKVVAEKVKFSPKETMSKIKKVSDIEEQNQAVKITMNLNFALHEKLRKYCFDDRSSRTEVINNAVEKYLKSKGY